MRLTYSNLPILMMTGVALSFVTNMFLPFQAPYIIELGGNPLIIGMIESLSLTIGIFVLVLGGFATDRYGRKSVLMVTAFLSAVGYFMVSIAANWIWIIFAVLLWQVSKMSDLAVNALIADSTKPGSRGISYAAFNLLPGIPSVAAPFLAGIAIFNLGFRQSMFWIGTLGAVTFIVSAMAFAFIKETKDNSAPRDENALQERSRSIKERLKLLSPRYLGSSMKWLFLIAGLFAIAEEAGGLLIAVYALSEVGVPAQEWGLLLSVAMAAVIPVGLMFGRLVDKMGTRTLLALLIASAISSTLIDSSFSPQVFLIAYFVLYMSNTGTYTAMDAFLADWTPQPLRGRAFGTLRLVSTLAALSVSPFVGLIYEAISFRLPFIVAGVAFFLAVLSVILLSKVQRRHT